MAQARKHRWGNKLPEGAEHARELLLDAAERWWEQVDASPRVTWEWIDPERAEKARRWFFRWRDRSFSFTDCTSFAVMKELRTKTALTSDRHFRQAGFQCLQ